MLTVSKRAPSVGFLPSRRFHGVSHRTLTQASAVKLYTNPGSRGKMPEWYLNELGTVQYQTVNLDMKVKDHKKPEYLEIHPFGQVPALVDGDLKIFESGAILLHLAHKYGGLSGDSLSKACQWVVYANATLGDALFGARKDTAAPAMISTLDKLLGQSKYIAGEEFSVSDVAVGGYLLYIPVFFPDKVNELKQYKNLWAYLTRLVERPKCPPSYKDGMKGFH